MSRPIYEPSLTRADAQLGYGSRQLFRRPPPLRAVVATLHIKVFPDENLGMGDPVETGDGKFIFAVSEDMDGLSLTEVECYVTQFYAAGVVLVQIRNETQTQDMLSTRLKIDSGEYHSGQSGSPAVINVANSEVSFMNLIAIDVDQADNDGWGLGVVLEFS